MPGCLRNEERSREIPFPTHQGAERREPEGTSCLGGGGQVLPGTAGGGGPQGTPAPTAGNTAPHDQTTDTLTVPG